ncbi:MAG TPA: Ig-like domain-containing protein, partial [Bryobacteraceae bacterium]|nr:Ig-like domain-containing protein [Bryobacteraceae bacterium]
TIQIVDATTLSVLDTQTVANFNGGVYQVWNVTGHVKVQVINTNQPTTAVSGLFFRSFTGIAPPDVTFVGPTANATVAGPVTMSVNAQSAQGIASVQFKIDGANVGAPVTGAGPVFTSHWASPLVSNGVHTISAVTMDNLGLRTTSSVAVTVSNGAAPTPSAILTSIDSFTSGSWKGVYGQDGEIIANDSTNPPFYATVNFVNTVNPPFTWHAGDPTTDLPGLQKANSNERIGATFYQATPNATFDIDVNFVDYQQHELSIYFVDWHHNVRAQTITIRDANTNAVLYSQYFTDFSLGVYYTWNITGHVIINLRLEQTPWNPTSVVASALFFQPPSVAARPTVSITSPTPSQTLNHTVTLSSAASSSIGVSAIQYELDGYALGAPVTSGAPFNFQWNTATTTNGSHILNAIAIDSSNHAITSEPITVTVSN